MKNTERMPKKRKRLIVKFIAIVIAVLLVYFIALGAYIAYTYLNGDDQDNYFTAQSGGTGFIPVIAPKLPERTNVLLLGVDGDETRTDSIMVASYNSITKKVSLISIPRDTLVTVPEDRWEVMLENQSGLKGNRSHQIKMNSVHTYAGKEHCCDYTKKQIEELLDININYYVKVNCEAFRYIVDSIGGIEFNVEQRMYYSDPTQNLYINLKPGLQVLDGDKAEQLVRFRYGYATQDLHRVEVQQEFMKVFMKTALSKDTILSNPTAYMTTMLKYVDTDLSIGDALKYFKFLSDISSAQMQGYTLPGEPKNIDGGSYFINDEEATAEMVYEVFKKPSTEPEDIVIEDSFGKNIQILNGGYTKGLAKSKKEKLEEEGYTVADIGDYSGERQESTRIYVSKEGQGRI